MASSIISVSTTGSFKNIEGFFKRTKKKNLMKHLEFYGARGVELLAAATPKDTGNTAMSWSYEIQEGKGSYSIYFKNSESIGNTPIVILIRYGHATKNGGYVVGNDFISPVLYRIFNEMADTIWKEVTK
ncbi:MAG: HK97 gp10 family phage protein [Clostridiales bacterium]|nr:HK97 gp10 family phage protein [Clostridiales bacterium]